MDSSALLEKLKSLLDKKDVLEKHGPRSDVGQAWLADVRAHLELADPPLGMQFARLMFYVVMPLSSYTLGPIWINMQALLRSAIAKLELQAPKATAKVYGPGDAYDVYRDLGQLISAAKSSVFLADPYTDEEVFELYLERLDKNVAIRLLTRPPSAALRKVASKFAARPGMKFEARFTEKIHDRVIVVDNTDCWVIGQSIKDAATKKPTYLLPVDAVSDMVRLYEEAWNDAKSF